MVSIYVEQNKPMDHSENVMKAHDQLILKSSVLKRNYNEKISHCHCLDLTVKRWKKGCITACRRRMWNEEMMKKLSVITIKVDINVNCDDHAFSYSFRLRLIISCTCVAHGEYMVAEIVEESICLVTLTLTLILTLLGWLTD